jgi:hypothetical protein
VSAARAVLVEQGADRALFPLFDNNDRRWMMAYCFKRVPVVRPFVSEETYIDANNKVRTSYVRGPAQVEEEVEVYSRTYGFLGLLADVSWDEIASHPNVVDEWDGWTGGRSSEPGDAVWIDRAVTK